MMRGFFPRRRKKFKATAKDYLIPRYKPIRVTKPFCEREDVLFKLVKISSALLNRVYLRQ